MTVRGFWPEEVKHFDDLIEKYKHIGFQATELWQAYHIFKKMVEDDSVTVFFGFTSNIISSGLREIVAYMAKERWVDVIITTVGSIEEDIMKTLGNFEIGTWDVDDTELHKKGINRIGNIFVPNELYIKLEEFLRPIFEHLHNKQRELGRLLAPSEMFLDIGKKLKDERSFLYWAAKNNIPVFCPAPTDGAFGLQFFYFKMDGHEDFGIDVTADMKQLADIVYDARKTGALIIGGGVPKHHIIGANLARGGLDYAVYITTAVEWDGSLSGARPKEAKSWGKIREDATTAFVYGDATTLLPLLVLGVAESLKR